MQKIGHIPQSHADARGEFIEGELSLGQIPTILHAAWLNTIQRELIAVLNQNGIAPHPDQDDQIYQAIRRLTPLQSNPILPKGWVHDGLSIFPEVPTPDGKIALTHQGGGILTIDPGQWFIWRGVWEICTDDYTSGERTFSLTANRNYHLRWRPNIGFGLYDLTDTHYNPQALAETDTQFDTQVDDMLLAVIQISANNITTITPLMNKAQLYTTWESSQQKAIGITGDEPFWSSAPVASKFLNWSRTPIPAWLGTSGWNFSRGYRSAAAQNETSWGVTATRYKVFMHDATQASQTDITGFYYGLEA